MKAILALLALLVALALSCSLTIVIIKLICWAFSLTFSLKMAFGIWLLILLLGSIFKSGN